MKDNFVDELNRAIASTDGGYKAMHNTLDEQMTISSVVSIDGHEMHIVAADKDGCAVRGWGVVLLEGCGCGRTYPNNEAGEKPTFEFERDFKDLVDEVVTKTVTSEIEGTLNSVVKVAEELIGRIAVAEADGYAVNTLYTLKPESGYVAGVCLYCTKVSKDEVTGLQRLGGFVITPEGYTDASVLSIMIGKEVPLETRSNR